MDSSCPSNTACLTALSVAELLSLILSYVDVRTLLLAQRVNRMFHAAITASPVLQRKLFFRPAPPQQAEVDDTAAGAREKASRLITYDDDLCREPRYIRQVQLNPLLVRSFPNFFPNSDVGGNFEDFVCLDWGRNAERAAAYAWPTASWRRMFLSDPLPENARLYCVSSYMSGNSRKSIDLLHGGKGVRMGLLYDLVQELVIEEGRYCNGNFMVRWQLAEPYTEAEELCQPADWEHFIVTLEGQHFDMDVCVRHMFSCVDQSSLFTRDLSVFRSKAPDVANFDSFEKEEMSFNISDILGDL